MLGNLYGKSVTHPVRRFEPTSQQVQSDQEHNEEGQGKLSNVPQFIETTRPTETVERWDTLSNFAPGATIFQTDYTGPNATSWNREAFPIQQPNMTVYGRETTGGGTISEANPEWNRLKNEMDAAMQFRQQNQTAQQQAYNGMLDQGQKNGVMGPGYSNPGFGRVDGQAQNPYSVDPGSNNMNWAAGYDAAPTGVYDPLQQTQETFWGL